MSPASEPMMIVDQSEGRARTVSVRELVRLVRDQEGTGARRLQPWLCETAVEAVLEYFRHDLRRQRVPLAEFVMVATRLLESFIRDVVISSRNLSHLDLLEVARRSGTGFELEFYPRIRRFFLERLDPAEPGGAAGRKTLHLTGLRQCAKFMAGRRRWSKRCAEARDEILALIRREAERSSSGARDITLAVLS